MEASGSNTGFFQDQPIIKNQFHDDVSVRRITERMYFFLNHLPLLGNGGVPSVNRSILTGLQTYLVFLPSSVLGETRPDIVQLGDDVLSEQIFDWVVDAEHSQPYLRGDGRDAFGKPKSELIVTEGWRKLQEFGYQKG